LLNYFTISMIARKRKYKKDSGQKKVLMGLLMFLDVLLVGFLLFGNLKLYAENKRMGSQYSNLDREIKALEKKNEELENLFSPASQEEHVERFLRDKGLYKKAGEEVVVIARENILDASMSEQNIRIESASVWDKIIIFFRQLFRR